MAESAFAWAWGLLLLLGLAALLTAGVRAYAMTRLIDVPNARSSHLEPTPRGGGLAIVASFALALFVLRGAGFIGPPLLVALMGLLPLAIVGFIDDHDHVPARWRLLVQLGSAAWALFWLGSPASLKVVEFELPGAVIQMITLVAMVWMVNLFNFMDGIDGIAGVETVSIALSAAGLMLWHSNDVYGEGAAALALAATTGGFLVWNWPPARIFMGDVGSGVLGFVLAVLMLGSWVDHRLDLVAWLILSSVFLVDATVTLLVRLLRGECWYQAHRTHAYQHASRHWGGHRPVTLAVLAINAFWLLPLAALATALPGLGAWLLICAWLPLSVWAYRLGAGRP